MHLCVFFIIFHKERIPFTNFSVTLNESASATVSNIALALLPLDTVHSYVYCGVKTVYRCVFSDILLACTQCYNRPAHNLTRFSQTWRNASRSRLFIHHTLVLRTTHRRWQSRDKLRLNNVVYSHSSNVGLQWPWDRATNAGYSYMTKVVAARRC